MIALSDRCPPEPPEFAVDADPDWPQAVKKAHQRLRSAYAAVEALINGGNTPHSEDFTECWKSYRNLLSNAQYGKCAYCESRFAGGYAGAVEQYRPKAAVRELRMTAGGRDPKFKAGASSKPAYWWLAYKFENYLYSCGSCNSAKGSYFPVKGTRPSPRPGSEKSETPRLLNPFLEDPAGHLRFNETGGVHGATSKGRWTVKICGLARPKLVVERLRVVVGLLRDIDDYEDALVAGNMLAQGQCLRRLLDSCSPDTAYSAMTRQLVWARVQLTYDELDFIVEAGIV